MGKLPQLYLDSLLVKVIIISPSIFIIYHSNHGWMMIYHHSRLHFRQSYSLNREREEHQGSQNLLDIKWDLFCVILFLPNVIIYIIVYANHSLPPEIVKVLSWLVSILAGEGHIMDKRREKNGVHFSDAGTFVFIVSVCYLHLPRLGSTLIWITICTVIWTGDQQLRKCCVYFSSTLWYNVQAKGIWYEKIQSSIPCE